MSWYVAFSSIWLYIKNPLHLKLEYFELCMLVALLDFFEFLVYTSLKTVNNFIEEEMLEITWRNTANGINCPFFL